MIDHKHECIFIHIPKTAGTSVEKALGHLDTCPGRGGQDHRTVRMIEKPLKARCVLSSGGNFGELARRFVYPLRHHVNARNRLSVSGSQYRRYFKFTIVRNPWARLYSVYRNVMRDEIHRRRLGIHGPLAFRDFVTHYQGVGMLKPQLYWVTNYCGEIPLDFVGRFERLAEDFAHVCRRIGIQNIELPHELKGGKEDYRDAYDEETKDVVRNTYREEIQTFGYEFE